MAVKTFIIIGIFRSSDVKSDLENEGDDSQELNKWKGNFEAII
jgi:hypothetical protein